MNRPAEFIPVISSGICSLLGALRSATIGTIWKFRLDNQRQSILQYDMNNHLTIPILQWIHNELFCSLDTLSDFLSALTTVVPGQRLPDLSLLPSSLGVVAI